MVAEAAPDYGDYERALGSVVPVDPYGCRVNITDDSEYLAHSYFPVVEPITSTRLKPDVIWVVSEFPLYYSYHAGGTADGHVRQLKLLAGVTPICLRNQRITELYLRRADSSKSGYVHLNLSN